MKKLYYYYLTIRFWKYVNKIKQNQSTNDS